MKAKDIDILILIIYAYAVQPPEHDWYMQTGKYTFVSIRKSMKILALLLVLCCNSFMQSQVGIRLVTLFCFKTSSA